MPSQFGGIEVSAPASTASKFGGVPIAAATPAARRDSAMDAISGFLAGAAGVLPAAGDALLHPLNTLRAGWDAQTGQFDKVAHSLNSGNYVDALQHLAGGTLPVLGPMASDFLDSVGDPNTDAHEMGRKLGQIVATRSFPDAVSKGAKLAASLPDAVPAAVATAARKVADHVVSKGISAATGIPSPLVHMGLDYVREHLSDTAADAPAPSPRSPRPRAAKPTPAAAAADPRPAVELAQGYATRPDAIPSQYGALPPLNRSQFFRPLGGDLPAAPESAAPTAEPVPESAPVPDPEAPPIVPEQAAAAAVSPAPVPDPESAQLAKSRAAFEAAKAAKKARTETAPAPDAGASDIEQKLQDSIDAVKAKKAAEAEAVKSSNRTKAADRWVAALNDLDLDPPALKDDAAWANLAQNLGERKGYSPSADTRALIHERIDAANTKAADAALRQRLADTLAPGGKPASPKLQKALADFAAAKTKASGK